jgi:hypothetical protein
VKHSCPLRLIYCSIRPPSSLMIGDITLLPSSFCPYITSSKRQEATLTGCPHSTLRPVYISMSLTLPYNFSGFSLFICFLDRFLLSSPGWPGTQYVAQSSLFSNLWSLCLCLPPLAPRILGIQVCTTVHNFVIVFLSTFHFSYLQLPLIYKKSLKYFV